MVWNVLESADMTRLLGIVAAESMPFRRCLDSLRRSSPSVPEEHFEIWSQVMYRSDETWDLEAGTVAAGENALLRLLTKADTGLALVSGIQGRSADGRMPRPAVACQSGWAFAHDGNVEDRPYVLSRTSLRRACPHEADSDLLLAFLLTRLDEHGVTDSVIAAAATEIGRRIGSLSFFLCDGATLYVHRFDRSLYMSERSDRRAVLFASEPLTTDGWVPLEDRTLVRCTRHRHGLELAFLSGRDPRPSSDIELPFTD
jgi:hypothetical protein